MSQVLPDQLHISCEVTPTTPQRDAGRVVPICSAEVRFSQPGLRERYLIQEALHETASNKSSSLNRALMEKAVPERTIVYRSRGKETGPELPVREVRVGGVHVREVCIMKPDSHEATTR